MYNKDNPFPATLIERTLLTQKGSTKKTYHLTLDVQGSGFSYKPGDALAIFPENTSEDVKALLHALKKSGQEEVIDPRSKKRMLIEQFLRTKVNFNRVSASLVEKVKGAGAFQKQPNRDAEWFDLIDFFNLCSHSLSFQELVSYFSPLLPRFYSIASSAAVQPNAVDLLVATFSYKQGKKEKQGLTPHYLCHQALMQTPSIYCYFQPTSHFVLPKDPKTPIIMIGPGTGIAPYRAFLQEREAKKCTGKNWLFFGERHRKTDYYYQSYLESLVDKNFLSLDVAFSRDQLEKCYVQDLLIEKGKEVWDDVSAGAHLYICGDASQMAKDVVLALATIFTKYGAVNGEAYIKYLRKARRLLLDVY